MKEALKVESILATKLPSKFPRESGSKALLPANYDRVKWRAHGLLPA